MTADTLSRSERIARLNDKARQAMGLACVVVVTEGFRALSEAVQSRVRELVETFDAFTPDNDPYGVTCSPDCYHSEVESVAKESDDNETKQVQRRADHRGFEG